MSDNLQQTIVDLLNQAAIYGKDNLRVQHLRHVQELILRKDANLLDHFLEEVLTFQTDKSIEVKKTIISFIEEACQINPQVILKVIDNLHFLLYDDNIFVRKKLILSLMSIYKSTLLWLSKSSLIDESVDRMWLTMSNMKNQILSQLKADNAGLCLVVIKFIEMLIITFTQYDEEFSTIDDRILSRKQCEQEGKAMIDKLIELTLSQHLSNVHLIAGVEVLTNIIRYRSDCRNHVLQSFEMLLRNLPSTLTESQTNHIRQIIQVKLCNLLKNSTSSDSQSQIINFLTNLGTTQTEILKYLPKTHPESKRQLSDHRCTKKFKNANVRVNNAMEKKSSFNDSHQSVTDLVGKLSIKNVVDLVLASMRSLPEKITASFQSNYTPIRDAGSSTQIESLARLLSAQLTGKNYDIIKSHQSVQANVDDHNEERKSGTSKTDGEHDVLLWSATVDIEKKVVSTFSSGISSTPINVKKRKAYKFSNAVQPIGYTEMQRMSTELFHRILNAKDICDTARVTRIHQKIIRSLVGLSERSFHNIFKDYLIDNIHERYDLAFEWIYQEYLHANGHLTVSEGKKKKDMTTYDHLLCQLLEYLQANNNDLFSRLLTSAPSITDNVFLILDRYCENESSVDRGMKILYDLILHRIPIRDKCLDILLKFTQNEKNSIRNNAIRITRSLYERNTFKQTIETYALRCLHISSMLKMDIDVSQDIRTEHSIELRFSLCLSLFPLNPCLIQPFANLYPTVNEDVQQELLQILEDPIREMGMNSPEISKLIRNCPKGAETLIIHIIHILTDQLPPSDELVETIRDLHHKHISDIRFLLPILSYLEKCEIESLLPQLIKLSPSILKAVFNELLDSKAKISPAELFIALHEISLEECELKIIIHATTLCLTERSIYTDIILTEIIEHLVEMTPIPLLFMRTVLQTLSLYPKMISFVINILQRLITKQVWQQTRIWEGFIKCCEKIRPHSYSLLLQLPLLQLEQIIQTESTLHDGLRHHLRSMSIAQRSSIPSSSLEMVEKTFHPSS